MSSIWLEAPAFGRLTSPRQSRANRGFSGPCEPVEAQERAEKAHARAKQPWRRRQRASTTFTHPTSLFAACAGSMSAQGQGQSRSAAALAAHLSMAFWATSLCDCRRETVSWRSASSRGAGAAWRRHMQRPSRPRSTSWGIITASGCPFTSHHCGSCTKPGSACQRHSGTASQTGPHSMATCRCCSGRVAIGLLRPSKLRWQRPWRACALGLPRSACSGTGGAPFVTTTSGGRHRAPWRSTMGPHGQPGRVRPAYPARLAPTLHPLISHEPRFGSLASPARSWEV